MLDEESTDDCPVKKLMEPDPVVTVGSFCLPLDTRKPYIRVLELQAGRLEEEIECRYHIRDLDDHDGVEFETLSYCWGPLTEHQTTRIEGHRVEVTDNLYSAFHNLRFENRLRLIWVDAVCINQSDMAEKEAQVNMMYRIYSQCSLCSCWLGDFRKEFQPIPMDNARGVVDFIHFLNNDCRGPVPLSLQHSRSQRLAIGTALRAMMDAAWWHRVWTVQEVVLPTSSKLVWGPLSIPWKSMIYAQEFLTESPGITNAQSPIDLWNFFYPANTSYFFTVPIHSLKTAALETSTPVDLFFRFRSRSATDPRDKVYGLMGLMKKIGFERIQSADYNQDIITLLKTVSVELVQIDGLKNWVGRSGAPHTLPGLPSWATDLTRNDTNQSIDGMFWWEHRSAYESFNADGRQGKMWLYIKEPSHTHLILKGIKKGWVVHVIKPLITELPDERTSEDEQIAAVDDQIRRWRTAVQSFLDNLHTKVDVSDADVTRVWCSFEKACTGTFSDAPLNRKAAERWKLEILRFKALAITNEADVGLVPRMTQFGDEIHVLIGGCVPFVTRPVKSIPENPGVVPGFKVGEELVGLHTLVGDSYVTGMMEGEAFQSKKDEELDWIVLR